MSAGAGSPLGAAAATHDSDGGLGTGRPVTPPALTVPDLVRYGVLRGPLALLELPLFVLLPAFYGDRLGMDLALIGTVLFATRLVDAFADPLIGAGLDRDAHPARYRRWILFALPILAIGYAALFSPPASAPLAAWLAIASLVTYIAYSAVSIAYQSWGAALARNDVERVRVTAWREGFGLAGVLLCASLLLPERAPWLVALFIALSALAAWALRGAPLPREALAVPAAGAPISIRRATAEVFTSRRFRALLAVFMLNGIASAIPATLVLFFVSDVLQLPQQAPWFLFAYFLAAAIGMPFWIRVAARLGLAGAWLVGMAIAVAAFVWTLGLGPGDGLGFLVVCLATGLALGADLSLPPAMLAAVIAREPGGQARRGAFFGMWNLATKLNLALAAGLALPLLAWLGYTPGGEAREGGLLSGMPGGPLVALAVTYAAVPVLLKCTAALLLWKIRRIGATEA
jgi:glycoside/pentoside/hexuronide:cation symporter, GPH family